MDCTKDGFQGLFSINSTVSLSLIPYEFGSSYSNLHDYDKVVLYPSG